jgi:2-aminoadipate transaminase
MNYAAHFAARTRGMQRSAVREFVKLTDRPGMISFAGGLPAPDLFPLEEMRQAADAVLAIHGPKALQYGETEGVSVLRDWIASRFSSPTLHVQRHHVLITSGAQQALSLLGQVFVDSDDGVLIESPTYLALLSAWRPFGARFHSVASDADGLRLDGLDQTLADRPKLFYVQPNYQNPQGTTLARTRRQQLVAWAHSHHIVLVEDNPYGELRYDGPSLPHLIECAIAPDSAGPPEFGAIHVGTFSKVLAPGLRVGWVIAPAEVIEKLVHAKQAADLHTSSLSQYLALELIQRGVLERQILRLREAYRIRRDVMLEGLEKRLPPASTCTRPAGGLFLMVTLPSGWKARELLQHALARNVAFVPGDEFHLDGDGSNTLRLNFSHPTPDQIDEGLRRLAQAIHDMAGFPVG